MNPYETLNVPNDATAAEIKKAHRKAAKNHHPDAGGSREDFEEIQKAYLILADPAKREKYDRTGSTEDTIDNSLAVLTEMVMFAFDGALGQTHGNPERYDLIKMSKKILEDKKRACINQRQMLQESREKFAKLRKRLSFKGTGPDVIGNTFKTRDMQLHESIDKHDAEEAAIIAAIAHLEHYGFEFEAVPQTYASWEQAPRLQDQLRDFLKELD